MTVTVEIHDLSERGGFHNHKWAGKINGRGARWVQGETFCDVLGTLLLKYRHRFLFADEIKIIDVLPNGTQRDA